MGLYEADTVIVVLSSHSAAWRFQGNSVAGIDPSFPDHRPWCATWEAITRYLPKYIPAVGMKGSNEGFHEALSAPQVVDQCLLAVKHIVELSKASGAKTYVMLHWTQPEIAQATKNPGWRPDGLQQIADAASSCGAEVIDLYQVEASSVHSVYRDDIHVNANGQELLAEEVMKVMAVRQ